MHDCEPQIEHRVRQLLKERFPLYEDAHLVWAVRKCILDTPTLLIGYYSSSRPFTTGFNLQIEGDCGCVLTFFIDEPQRKRGHGRRLYEVMRAICRDYGCARIRLALSGDGPEFWPAMGFQPCNEYELEARLV
jgi:GNAT superfamily N-acetyltransferase